LPFRFHFVVQQQKKKRILRTGDFTAFTFRDFRNDILINLSASLGLFLPAQLGLTSAHLLNLRCPYQTVSQLDLVVALQRSKALKSVAEQERCPNAT